MIVCLCMRAAVSLHRHGRILILPHGSWCSAHTEHIVSNYDTGTSTYNIQPGCEAVYNDIEASEKSPVLDAPRLGGHVQRTRVDPAGNHR